MKWLRYCWETKKIALLITVLLAFFVCYSSTVFDGDGSRLSLITVIITIVTIIIGFATASLALLIGVVDKAIMQRIRNRNVLEDLIYHFKDLLYNGGIVILIAIIMTLYDSTELPTFAFLAFKFLFLFFTFWLSRLLIVILKSLQA